MKDSSKVIGALVLGAAAGAVLGLMFAPSSGPDLRKKLKDNADDLIDELADKINEGRDTLENLKAKAMKKAESMRGTMEEEAESFMSNGDGKKYKPKDVM